jgi:hypothetical protein
VKCADNAANVGAKRSPKKILVRNHYKKNYLNNLSENENMT